ncbi:Cysteine dioxygenase [Trichostrongylus colubriformis]|uniref:Cysteine dioxygenase n=1 Tax=Trichostrongylus colubriformis TaxID=6319 RepID=A0AAN8ISA1_TRICO
MKPADSPLDTSTRTANTFTWLHSFACRFSRNMVTLTELVATLRQIFADSEVNVAEVMHLMESYKSNPAEWKQYANFDEHK